MSKVYCFISDEEYAIAESNGIRRSTLESRIRKLGWSKERAITEQVDKFKKWVSLAEKNGISRASFYMRKNELGWSLEESATVPIMSKEKIIKKMHKCNRKHKKEHVALAKSNGIKYSTFATRVNQLGWNPIKAATIKPRNNESE